MVNGSVLLDNRHAFLDSIGQVALLEPLLHIFERDEQPPCMESLCVRARVCALFPCRFVHSV